MCLESKQNFTDFERIFKGKIKVFSLKSLELSRNARVFKDKHFHRLLDLANGSMHHLE